MRNLSATDASADISLQVAADAGAAAQRAAEHIAAEAQQAVRQRGRFALALSGGSTPQPLWSSLARQDLPWRHVHVAQVDERLAPQESGARNFTALQHVLLQQVSIPAGQVYPMPVVSTDPGLAVLEYAGLLEKRLGTPPVFDLVHLGLGTDGHTASLLPGDAALATQDRDVALTGLYQGWQRMTLTLPILNRARRILWFVTGEGKAQILSRLLAGDRTIPAGRVRRTNAVAIADRAAAPSPGGKTP